jgi:environmental stress-induced protein Ves
MNKTIKILAVTALFSAQPLAFACDYPTKAQLPNGATATKEDMLAGQTAVKEYMTAMETYLTCIEQEEKDTVASMTEITEEERASRDATLTKKYNAAVEEMELLAAQFNEEVRAYKAKSE